MIATAYDHSGFHRVQIEMRRGDIVDWKRNGSAGSFKAEFLGAVGSRLQLARIRLLEAGREVNVKPRFSAVFRDGTRLP